MKIHNSHTGALLGDTNNGSIGITDVDPDNLFTVHLIGGDTLAMSYCQMRALLQLLDKVVDMDLFRTLIEDVEISDASAMSAAFRGVK